MTKKAQFTLFLLTAPLLTHNFLAAQSPLADSIQKALQGAQYVVCLDGGGSKTELQILDSQGQTVALTQNDTCVFSVRAGGSNINAVGKAGIKNALDAVLRNVKISTTENNTVDILSLASQCTVIGGFSGAGSAETKNSIKEFVKEYGFNNDKIIVTSDGDMTLESVNDNGIILISGTGSICFGKNGTDLIRVGGLGRYISDDGSGYYIGIRGLRAALEDEYGWGQATSLKMALRTYFKTSDLKTIISPFYKGEITNYQIAATSPIVFDHAEQGDALASKIISKAATKLGTMLACMIQKGKFTPCPIYFFGGTFKNKNAPQFIQTILKSAHLEEWKTYNKAQENPTVLAVQKIQKHINKETDS